MYRFIMAIIVFLVLSLPLSDMTDDFSFLRSAGNIFTISLAFADNVGIVQSNLDQIEVDLEKTLAQKRKWDMLKNVIYILISCFISAIIGYLLSSSQRKKGLAAIEANDPSILPLKFKKLYKRKKIPQEEIIENFIKDMNKDFFMKKPVLVACLFALIPLFSIIPSILVG